MPVLTHVISYPPQKLWEDFELRRVSDWQPHPAKKGTVEQLYSLCQSAVEQEQQEATRELGVR